MRMVMYQSEFTSYNLALIPTSTDIEVSLLFKSQIIKQDVFAQGAITF